MLTIDQVNRAISQWLIRDPILTRSRHLCIFIEKCQREHILKRSLVVISGIFMSIYKLSIMNISSTRMARHKPKIISGGKWKALSMSNITDKTSNRKM